jgi:hypothetical protein
MTPAQRKYVRRQALMGILSLEDTSADAVDDLLARLDAMDVNDKLPEDIPAEVHTTVWELLEEVDQNATWLETVIEGLPT